MNMNSDLKVSVSKWIRAKRDKVFSAWTEPEVMRQWFFPRELTLVSAESDVRVGGRFRAAMSNGTQTYTVCGTYHELVPDQRLVFSHRWEEQDAVETLVTVEFEDRDGGTLVSLTHEGFRTPEAAKGHEGGWHSTLENLAHFLDAHRSP
jgi:uncharacterized protein YndB with AHSA1/START domain